MPTVTLTVRVHKVALPTPEVQVGLDKDDGGDVEAGEFRAADATGGGVFTAEFVVSATAGRSAARARRCRPGRPACSSRRGKGRSLPSRPARDYCVPMSAAAAQLLDAIVPIVRTRLPRGVDVDYLDDFLARNRFALEAVIEQNLGPILSRMQAAGRLPPSGGARPHPRVYTPTEVPREVARVVAPIVHALPRDGERTSHASLPSMTSERARRRMRPSGPLAGAPSGPGSNSR